MISALEVTRLRGIESGALRDLTPLTILVGPNGSGKSTILDAMLIAASRDPARGVRYVVQRRPLTHGARWLVHGGPTSTATAGIRVELADACAYTCELTWLPEEFFPAKHEALARRWGEMIGAIRVEIADYDANTAELHLYRDASTTPWGIVGFSKDGEVDRAAARRRSGAAARAHRRRGDRACVARVTARP